MSTNDYESLQFDHFDIEEYMRWHDIIMLVAMDCVRPLYERMGLPLTEVERDAISSCSRQIYEEFEITTGEPLVSTGQARSLINRFLSNVVNAIGLDRARKVVSWGENYFSDLSEKSEFEASWTDALETLCRLNSGEFSSSTTCNPTSMDDDLFGALIRLVEAKLLGPNRAAEAALDAAAVRCKSDWDRRVVEDYEAKYDVGVSILDRALETTQRATFRDFWHHAEYLLADHVDALFEWYQSQAADLSIPKAHLRIPKYAEESMGSAPNS
jgi:hypothetical protein